jgi:hypothetical protein
LAEDVRYFAVVGDGRTIDDPSGLVRRRTTAAGQVDESIRRDLSWGFTDALQQQQRGENFGPDLVEISSADAAALIERFRARWAAS